jgi:hypothetical protein
MNAKKYSDSQLSTSVRGTLLILIASLFTFIPTASSHAATFTHTYNPGEALDLTDSGMTFKIPVGAVTETYTVNITSVGTTDLSQVAVTITGWVYGTNHFNAGHPAMITMPKSSVPYSQLGYSEDSGATWTLIPLVTDSSTITNTTIGTGYVVSGSNVMIYTYLLSTFCSFVNSSLAAAADAAAQAAAEARREAAKQAARVEISNTFTDSKAPTLQQFSDGEIAGVTSKNLADVNKELLALPLAERSDLAVIQKVAKKYLILDSISLGGTFTSITAKDLSDAGLVPVANRNAITYALRSLPTSVRDSYAKITIAINEKLAVIKTRMARIAALR